MFRTLLRAKLHRLTVTAADLNYEGSITLPPDLIAAGQFVENEHVHVWNVTNGNRFQTYVIKGQDQSRDVCVNGAGARLVATGDILIVAAFCQVEEANIDGWLPRVIFVNDANEPLQNCKELPGPQLLLR